MTKEASEVLFGVYKAKRKSMRPALVYCGDDVPSKEIATRLIRDVGFAPLDVGPLRIARYTEPFALLIAQKPQLGAPDAGAASARRPSMRRAPADTDTACSPLVKM